jgi:hypothetical protein
VPVIPVTTKMTVPVPVATVTAEKGDRNGWFRNFNKSNIYTIDVEKVCSFIKALAVSYVSKVSIIIVTYILTGGDVPKR